MFFSETFLVYRCRKKRLDDIHIYTSSLIGKFMLYLDLIQINLFSREIDCSARILL